MKRFCAFAALILVAGVAFAQQAGQAALRKMVEEKKQLMALNEEKNRQINELFAMLDQSQQALEQLDRKLQAKDQFIILAEKQLSAKNEAAEAEDAERAQLTERVEWLRSQKVTAENTAMQMGEVVGRLEEENAALRAALKSKKDAVAALTARQTEADATIAALQKKLAALSSATTTWVAPVKTVAAPTPEATRIPAAARMQPTAAPIPTATSAPRTDTQQLEYDRAYIDKKRSELEEYQNKLNELLRTLQ